MDQRFDVVGSIVLYKTPLEDLERVVESFFKDKADLKQKLCLIDNSPEKTEIKSLLAYGEIDYIYLGYNRGYGYGHNIAINKYTRLTKNIVILNPDVHFDKGVLWGLFKKMNQGSNIGLCIPKVCFFDGRTQYVCKKLPTPFDLGIRFITTKFPNLRKYFKKRIENIEIRDFNDSTKNFYCPSISGCFMFFNSKILKNIGGFDERYFMYQEDIDLSRRIARISDTIVVNSLKVYHRWEKGSYQNNKLLMNLIISSIKYFNKFGWFFDKERIKLNNKIKFLS